MGSPRFVQTAPGPRDVWYLPNVLTGARVNATDRNHHHKMTKKRSSRRKKRGSLKLPSISLDQALDWIGYILLAVTALTLLSFLSANHGVIPSWWVGVLRRTFGWGAFLIPFFLGALGLWLVLREFKDKLPSVTIPQILGGLLGYVVLLTTLHLMSAFTQFDGNLTAAALAGQGGGRLGALFGRILLTGLGGVGTVITLFTIWMITIALVFGFTVKDAEQLIKRTAPAIRINGRPQAPIVSAASFEDDFLDTRLEEEFQPEAPVITAPTLSRSGNAANTSRPPASQYVHTIGSDQQWRIPALAEVLDPGGDQDFSAEILRQQARIIEDTLESLGAPVRVKEINRGPVVTQFGIEPLMVRSRTGKETKVKVSRISKLSHDLALALEARTLRVEAPIPGKGLVGIEVPNPEVSLVALRDIMESDEFLGLDSALGVCLGQDVSGHPMATDLTTMPHLLIAGTTGSGKSVCINSIIAALLLQYSPDDLKFLMVDPKRVELTGYNGIPHLVSKVVVEMERVTGALQWVLREMDGRYRKFADARATHIRDYNARIAPSVGEKPIPYIVVIIDELADMMMMAPQETERIICRIAQMARATGIHLVVATQRPSVNVVTGLIKANFSARIAFNVASSVDSRVILDMPGAEQLLGQGDMLFLPPDAPAPLRLQGAFVSNEELRRLVHHWKEQGKPQAVAAPIIAQPRLWEDASTDAAQPAIEFEDELLPDVVELVIRENRASISLLQRKLKIGYTRAARIMDILEQHHVVGPQPPGGKAREVFPGAARALLAGESSGAG